MPLRDSWFFSMQNNVAEAELGGTENVLGFGRQNTVRWEADLVWRTASGPMVLTGELEAPKPSQVILIRFVPETNPFVDGEVATLTLSNISVDDSELGTYSVDLAPDPFTGCVATILDAPVDHRYFKISLPQADVEYVHLGPAFFPVFGYAGGSSLEPIYNTTVERSLFSGGVTIQQGATSISFAAQFQVADADRATWRSIQYGAGLDKPFVFGVSQTTRLEESFVAHLLSFSGPREFAGQSVGQLQLEALR